MVSHIYKLTSQWHGETTLSLKWRKPASGSVFSTLCWRGNTQLWHRVLKLPSLPINPKLRSKVLSRTKMKLWAIYTNLPVSDIERVPHPWSGNSQSQKTFLAPSADKETRKVLKPPSLPISSKLRSKGLSCTKIEWWAIYTNLPVSDIVTLPHPWSGGSQSQKTFLASNAEKQTHIYDTERENHHPSLLTLNKGQRDWAVARWNGEPYIQIYQWVI